VNILFGPVIFLICELNLL